MARIVVATTPFHGHVAALAPIVRALVERGNDVVWYSGEKYRQRIMETGAAHAPMSAATDYDDQDLGATFPGWEGLDGLQALKFMIKHVCTDAVPGQIEDLRTILSDFPAEVILADTTFLGSRWLHELGGPPWATFNQLPLTISSCDTAPFGTGLPPAASRLGRARARVLHELFSRIVFRDVSRYTDQKRAELGLPPTGAYVMDNQVSPFLYLQGSAEAFEYPRSDLPSQVHFIGPVLPGAPEDFVRPDWWSDLHDERPVVHVTQGTLATQAEQLIAPTIRALADDDVLVVATTGGGTAEGLRSDQLPDNVRVESFVPHAHLLPHVDLMITNGGFNGVQMALSHGVPLVAGGVTEDKPEVCARIDWAGVGINLKTAEPGEQKIREAVQTVLSEPGYRQRARKLADEFARYNASEDGARLVERLAETGEPVLRT